MDYRALLKKYINHVGNCEGVTFIDSEYGFGTGFTKDELQELHELENELDLEL